MRLFLAIFPPKEYAKYFGDVYRKLDKQKRNIKPTPYDQIHFTLKFVGANVSEDSKDRIYELLKKYEGQYTKPTIEIDKVQFGFDMQRDPRHLLAMIKQDQSLLDFNNEIHLLIKSLKLRDTIRWKEKHSNDFHVTIARMKNTATKSSGKQIIKLMESAQRIPVPAAFIPERIDFMESVMLHDGPVYRKIASVNI